MPPLPVPRTDKDYHYHVYDYDKSTSFALSPGQPSAGGMKFYSLKEDLYGLLQAGLDRKVPNITLTPYGAPTDTGLNTLVLTFGNAAKAQDMPWIVITGGIHAREWISSEFVYLLAEYLIINYNPGQPRNIYEHCVRELVDKRQVCIIPMLNPDGNHFSVFTDKQAGRLWRKNRRRLPTTHDDWRRLLTTNGKANPPFQNVRQVGSGLGYDVPEYSSKPTETPDYNGYALDTGQYGVDPGRNYKTPGWGHNCLLEASPASDTYFGPRAGSEAETANVIALLSRLGRIAAAIDYHSYAGAILYPTEPYDTGEVDSYHKGLGQVLLEMSAGQAGPPYRLGTPDELIGYNATGTVADYIALLHHGRALSIELDPSKWPEDPGDNGWRLAENQIRPVFEKNIRGALATIWSADADPRYGLITFQDWIVSGRGNQLPVRSTGQR
jgi:zinc carboxypeptidase